MSKTYFVDNGNQFATVTSRNDGEKNISDLSNQISILQKTKHPIQFDFDPNYDLMNYDSCTYNFSLFLESIHLKYRLKSILNLFNENVVKNKPNFQNIKNARKP